MLEECDEDVFQDLGSEKTFKYLSIADEKLDSKNSVKNDFTFVPDFSVKVREHFKRRNNFEAYIVYKIESTNQAKQYLVERRYSDFLWLMQRMIEKYPVTILPPLPQKHSVTALERFSGDFIDQRLVALDRFLQRLSQHPIVGCDDELWSFLSLTESMFDTFKRNRPVIGKFDSLMQSIQSFSAGTKSSAMRTDQISNVKKIFDDGIQMASIMNRLGRVVKRTADVWSYIGTSFSTNSNNDGCDELLLLLPGANGQFLKQFSDNCKESSSQLRFNIDPWITESNLYWNQADRAARKCLETESKFLASNVKSIQSSDGIPVEQQNETSRSINKLHDDMSRNNADLMSEIDRFTSERSKESKEWLEKFADLHVNHYSRSCDIWKQMLCSMSLSESF